MSSALEFVMQSVSVTQGTALKMERKSGTLVDFAGHRAPAGQPLYSIPPRGFSQVSKPVQSCRNLPLARSSPHGSSVTSSTSDEQHVHVHVHVHVAAMSALGARTPTRANRERARLTATDGGV